MCFFNRYCDCFANGEFCNNCNCNNCFNNLEHETERLKAIKVRLEGDTDVASSQDESPVKTPFITDLPRPEPRGLQTQNWERKRGRVGPATQQRLQLQTVRLPEELLRVLRGGFQEPFPSVSLLGGKTKAGVYIRLCLFFHLEKAKIMCSSICKCIGCKNFEESPERKTLMHLADAAEVRVQQQTAAKTKLSSQISDLLTRTTPVITSGAGRYGNTFLHINKITIIRL